MVFCCLLAGGDRQLALLSVAYHLSAVCLLGSSNRWKSVGAI